MWAGLCPPPPTLFPGRDPYFCSFTAFVGGTAGYVENNTVTATGRDEDDNVVQALSQASVTVQAETPSIEATKTANPRLIESEGSTVTFTFTVSNTSGVSDVTIEELTDSTFGNLDGQGDCRVPQTLKPGESYRCSLSRGFAGDVGDVHVNQLVASGSSEDGKPVLASDVAAILFTETSEIPTVGRWGLGLMILLMGWLGFIRMRSQ